MAHDDVEGHDGLVGDLSGAALERLLQAVERDLGDPLDGDAEEAVLALAGQRDLELFAGVADGQRVSGVQVAAPVEDRLQVAEDLAVRVHHRFDYLSVYLNIYHSCCNI